MSLEELFINAFKDESLQNVFFYELLQKDVYVLAESESFRNTIEDGEEMSVMCLNHEGVSYVPVFLSHSSMVYFLDNHKQGYLKVKGNDLFETLKDYNVVLNPGQKDTMVLYADEIKEVLAQSKN